MGEVNEALQPARLVSVGGLAGDPSVQTDLALMHALAQRVAPDCNVKQRRDGALIYVPAELAHLPDGAANKNLLTLWPRRRPLGLRIMFPKQPTPGEEAFVASQVENYRARLSDLYREVLSGPAAASREG